MVHVLLSVYVVITLSSLLRIKRFALCTHYHILLPKNTIICHVCIISDPSDDLIVTLEMEPNRFFFLQNPYLIKKCDCFFRSSKYIKFKKTFIVYMKLENISNINDHLPSFLSFPHGT